MATIEAAGSPIFQTGSRSSSPPGFDHLNQRDATTAANLHSCMASLAGSCRVYKRFRTEVIKLKDLAKSEKKKSTEKSQGDYGISSHIPQTKSFSMSWGGSYARDRGKGLAPETLDLVAKLGVNASRRQITSTINALQDAKRGKRSGTQTTVAVPRPTGRSAPPPRLPPARSGRKKVLPDELEREQYHGQGKQGINLEREKEYLVHCFANPNMSAEDKLSTRAILERPAAAILAAAPSSKAKARDKSNSRVEELEKMFAKVQSEIDDRSEFLEEMERSGMGAKYRKEITDEVRERVGALKRIDAMIEEELGRAVASK